VVLGAPFIGPEEGAGRPDGEEDRAAGGGGINAGRPVRWGGETEGRVGSEEGECDAVSGRGGDAGAVPARARDGAGGCAVGFSRRKKVGRGPHGSERRGWRLGRPEAKARWLGLGRGRRPKRGEGEWAGG
jgi:hypothetical protein